MYKYVEIKLYIPEQPMGQRRNENEHFLISQNKWKWKHNIPKLSEFVKSVLSRKFIEIIAYVKKTEIIQINKNKCVC